MVPGCLLHGCTEGNAACDLYELRRRRAYKFSDGDGTGCCGGSKGDPGRKGNQSSAVDQMATICPGQVLARA